jgi:hypothetical protein
VQHFDFKNKKNQKIMENEVKENKSTGLKILVALLVFLLGGSLFYNYKLKDEVKEAKISQDKIVAEKAVIESDLQKQIDMYTTAINEKSAISEELIAEKAKTVKLLAEVKKATGDPKAMAQLKKEHSSLQEKYKQLMAQNEELKKQNITLTTQRDSTVAVLGETKKYNDDLVNQNNELTTTVIKAAKLTVVAVKTTAYKLKGSGKMIETDKASAADLLRVTFSVAENVAAKAGDKPFYVQIIDANNNVIGDKKTETFGTKSLTYSFKANIKYANKTVNFSQEMLGKKFEKGTYFVNIFDKADLVADYTFTLR